MLVKRFGDFDNAKVIAPKFANNYVLNINTPKAIELKAAFKN